MRLRRVAPVLVVLPCALAACTAVIGLESLSFEDAADASVDRRDAEGGTTDAPSIVDGGADTGPDAKPPGSGACASLAPLFAETFTAFDGGGWTATQANCAPFDRKFPEGPDGPYAELSCTSTSGQAFTVYQTAAALPENTHIEAELRVSLDPAAPEHAFAQGVAWITNVTNLRFFSGPGGVSAHVDNGPVLAAWALRPAGFYLLEVQAARLTQPDDAGAAMGRVRVVFDGEAKFFDVPIDVTGPSQRMPAFQIGPYFPISPGGDTAVDRYDSIKLWSCP